MKNDFVRIEDCHVITWEKGVFKKQDIYEYEKLLFCTSKGGFIRIEPKGNTSHQSVRWNAIEGIAFRPAPVFNGMERIL